MKEIRLKIFLSNLLFYVFSAYLVDSLKLNSFSFYAFVVFVSLVYYFVNYWLYSFNVHPIGLLTVLVLPSMLLSSYLLFIYYFALSVGEVWLKIFCMALFVVLGYYLVLNQNLLNVWYFEGIGLHKMALNINLFYTNLVFAVFAISIFLSRFEFIVKLVVLFVIFVILYVIFSILNEIRLPLVILSSIFFLFFLVNVFFLFILGFVNFKNYVLVSVALMILFKSMTVSSLYYVKGNLGIMDKITMVLESLIIFALLMFSSF